MKYKFGSYKEHTPLFFIILGDSIVGVCSATTVISITQNNKTAAIVLTLFSFFGSFLTKFFSAYRKEVEKETKDLKPNRPKKHEDKSTT